ncbi:MAG: TIGR03617 family F420-dependent LLM class oxidoreductase [Actinomycetota bacterium]|nr:TIGR03617 family F420-dependent LLM class oxidoreductase [Actinomycetota bacterium]
MSTHENAVTTARPVPVLSAFGSAPSLAGAQELSRRAAAAGFTRLWIPESSQPVFSVCTAAALASPGLALGTGVAVAFARSPMITAQAGWMLAQATGGRFVLGLGTQVKAHVERRYSAPFAPPGPRMSEYVASLRAIFRAFREEERLRFEGDYYSFSLLPPTWSPGPMELEDPPIYVAGVRPWMCRMIGQVADGMLVHPLNSSEYLRQVVVAGVAEGERRAARPEGAVDLVCPVMTAVADDEAGQARQRDQIRARLAFYGSTPGYGVVFDVSGWPGVGERLNQLQREGRLAEMAGLITDDMVDAFAITATWDELPGRLLERFGGLAADITCYSVMEQWREDPASVERWADVNRRFSRLTAD